MLTSFNAPERDQVTSQQPRLSIILLTGNTSHVLIKHAQIINSEFGF